MSDLIHAMVTAFWLMASFDADLVEIVLMSLHVSLVAVGIAAVIGLPLGAALAVFRFPGRGVVVVVTNALMGLPPVVVGLIVYLLLSRSGPFGVFGLLFTPTAMIIAQIVLVLPIIASLTHRITSDLWEEYREQLISFGIGRKRAVTTVLWDGRVGLSTAVLAGFGRASAEVGAVMIVGGNIDHVTRVMTTAIAMETSKGDLALALGLGIVLIIISLAVNSVTLGIGAATGPERALS